MLTSTDLENLPAEAQEIVNLLSQNDYKVRLLQSNVTSLELYRTLRDSPFMLVWLASHSGEQGFAFGANIITPTELGQFLVEAKANDLILNSCYSVQHVQVIQNISNVNVLAVLDKELKDTLAWTSAIYLAQALVRTGELYPAYTRILSGNDSVYRYFPSPKKQMDNSPMESSRLEKVEKTLEWMGRILSGDPYLHAAGLMDTIDVLRETLKQHIEADGNWKRDTEARIKLLETTNPTSNIVLTRQSFRLTIILFIVVSLLLIYLVYLLKG